MFFGTIPSVVGQYLLKELSEHNPQRIFVPFAGNFVVEIASEGIKIRYPEEEYDNKSDGDTNKALKKVKTKP